MKYLTFCLFILIAAFCILGQLEMVYGAITWTGDVAPTDPATWNSNTKGYVGKTADGAVTITGSGAVASGDGLLGYLPGSIGEVTVDGVGSTWTNSRVLSIGLSGTGTLNITGGGAVNSSNAVVGYDLGYHSESMGVVNVDGSGSMLIKNQLDVGYSGNGTLNISGGGTVTAGRTFVSNLDGSTGLIHFGPGGGLLTSGSLLAGPSQLLGTGTINTRGLVSDVDLVFDETHGLTQMFTFNSEPDQNVTLHLDLSGGAVVNGYSGAGFRGNGSLTIQDGMVVYSSQSYVGYHRDSTGVASVNGSGSRWIEKSGLCVGSYGDGTLSITGGGAVSSSGGTLGFQPGSTAKVSVDGLGSTWAVSSNIHVGYFGSGILNITNGATVCNEMYGFFVGKELGSKGEVNVDRTGSVWSSIGYLYVGVEGEGTLNIINGGLVRVGGTSAIDWNGDDDSFVNMASGGMLALLGDSDASLGVFLKSIAGTGVIRYWNDSNGEWEDITGATPGVDYTLAYVDDKRSDLHGYTVLTVLAVPEPSIVLMLLFGVAMLLLPRSRSYSPTAAW